MKKTKEIREEWLVRAVDVWEELIGKWAVEYSRDYHKLNRGAALRHMTPLSEDRGLRCFFIENNISGLKQNFYVFCRLLMASQKELKSGSDVFADHTPFLYGLLSDNADIYSWLADADLEHNCSVKEPYFLYHQFQLVMRCDDEALNKSIALVAKEGGRRNKALAQSGQDFFSLLLNQDKQGLQALIEDQAKIKPSQELEGQFLAGFAAIHAKLCWYRGIEVQIKNPLVPMELLPIEPLDSYDVEYDFSRPGWMPPAQGLISKIKRLLSR